MAYIKAPTGPVRRPALAERASDGGLMWPEGPGGAAKYASQSAGASAHKPSLSGFVSRIMSRLRHLETLLRQADLRLQEQSEFRASQDD